MTSKVSSETQDVGPAMSDEGRSACGLVFPVIEEIMVTPFLT